MQFDDDSAVDPLTGLDCSEVEATGNQRFPVVSASNLQKAVFPVLKFCIDPLISPGLTILAGRPKEGKSWMVLEMALAVATGSPALGQLTTDAGDVLYLALEDNQRRLQNRLRKLRPSGEWPDNLLIATEWSRLDAGGLDEIANWYVQAQKPKMVVIDVFAKVRSEKGSGQNGYDSDYRAAAPLQEFAVEVGLSVIVVHHTRKMFAEDPLESVSGTNGLMGAADSTFVLKREAINSGDAVLYGRGRDIPEIELALSFDGKTGAWRSLGSASEFRASKEAKKIIDILNAAGKPMSINDIAEGLGGVVPATLRQRLKRLSDKGEIRKLERGLYGPVTSVTLSQ